MNEREIFAAVLERSTEAERQKFLNEVCDDAMRQRIERLLKEHSQLGSFLDHPPLEDQAGILNGISPTIVFGGGSTCNDEGEVNTSEHKDLARNPEEPDEEIPLGYLQPATRENSLGRLGHYEVLNVVGKGAFGTVLRAFDTKLERIVAIKVLAPEMAATSPARKRFLREARTSAAIRHENVVAIHAVEDEPIPYLVMEFIPGHTLQQRLDKHGPLSVAEVLKLGKQIADGLAAAHAQDLIHRDIKPGNILLEGGVTERVKITDFGLARTADDASMTQSGLIAGTPMYMAPEQALGHKLDQRADLFSFGSVLYQMLSGRPPFRAANTVAVLKRVVDDTPRPIQEIIPEVPTWMCELVSHLHAKNPDDRYQTAREVSDLLGQCLEELKAGGVPTLRSPSLNIAATIEHSPALESEQNPIRRIKAFLGRPLVRTTVAAVILLGVINFKITPKDGPINESKVPASAKVEMLYGSGSLEASAGTSSPDRTRTSSAVGWHGWPADAPQPAIAPFDAAQAKRHQDEWATYLNVPVEFTNSIGMKFVLIPPGEFTMGSTAAEIEKALQDIGDDKYWRGCIQSEAPAHKVILTQPFYLGVHEVTQAEYEKVMGSNPSHFAPLGKGQAAVAGLETAKHPVEMVSANDAAEFCARLSEQEKLQPPYHRVGETVTPLYGSGYRLPSEAEWEFACRAGTTTKFWSGDKDEDLMQAGWFVTNSDGRTHAAGDLKANPFGLSDTLGNVWEWVQDGWDANYYGQFQERIATNPASPFSDGSPRVLRGGNWYSTGSHCRSSFRHANVPTGRTEDVGFRVSLVVDAVKQRQNVPSDAIESKPHQWPADAPPPANAPFAAERAKVHQETWAKYLGLPVEKKVVIGKDNDGKDISLTMVLIPPGEFLMGSSQKEVASLLAESQGDDQWTLMVVHRESPQHRVRISRPFYLSKYETTQAQWQAVVGNLPSGIELGPQLPVSKVNWNETQTFFSKLNVPASYDGWTFHLPTEAQWEYACRAGSTERWYFGDNKDLFEEHCWFEENSNKRANPVGRLKPNAFGLHDVLGNVWEWCADRFAEDYFAVAPAMDPAGPLIGESSILRGGHYDATSRNHCRSAERDHCGQGVTFEFIGFRICATLPEAVLKPSRPNEP